MFVLKHIESKTKEMEWTKVKIFKTDSHETWNFRQLKFEENFCITLKIGKFQVAVEKEIANPSRLHSKSNTALNVFASRRS